jgi:hypothetical protein
MIGERQDGRQTISLARRRVIGLGTFTRTYLGTFAGTPTPVHEPRVEPPLSTNRRPPEV